MRGTVGGASGASGYIARSGLGGLGGRLAGWSVGCRTADPAGDVIVSYWWKSVFG